MWTNNAAAALPEVTGYFAVADPQGQPLSVRVAATMTASLQGDQIRAGFIPAGRVEFHLPPEAIDADGCARLGFFRAADHVAMWLSPAVLAADAETIGLVYGTEVSVAQRGVQRTDATLDPHA
jgi:hypothetical protein